MRLPDIKELRELATFADCKSLTEASQKLHISQSALSRAMQNLEQCFEVPLFTRSKNKIELSDTGHLAAEHAKRLISQIQGAICDVQAHYNRLHTINLISCAPAPLWTVIPTLNNANPEKNITSGLALSNEEVIAAIKNGQSDFGIIAGCCNEEELICKFYGTESLSVLIPKGHPLYDRESVSFEDLNGFNWLLRDDIGFWTELVRTLMPASRFLIQKDAIAFDELVRSSSLLRFFSDRTHRTYPETGDRKNIPITSPAATVRYYFVCQEKNRYLLHAFATMEGINTYSPHPATTIREKEDMRIKLNDNFEILTAKQAELDEIMNLIEGSRKIMIANGNPNQWPAGYPSKDMVAKDLAEKKCRIIKFNDTVAGSFVVTAGPDPTYLKIFDGHWLNDSPYIVIHRVTSNPRFQGVFSAVIAYCKALNGHIRVDTHKDNTIMQHLLKKHGFEYCGLIHIENGEERLAFEINSCKNPANISDKALANK